MNGLIITGASRGIGHETAKLFLSKNWEVINLSRSPSDLHGITNISVDLSHYENIKKRQSTLIDLAKQFDKICLTHNAAKLISDTADKLDPTELLLMFQINTLAPAFLNTLLIPYMNRGSSIIYVGSTLSELAVPGAASYIITKHAIVGLMKATCQDLASMPIHTCCICPGCTDTQMLREHIGNNASIIEAIKSKVGVHRFIEPCEIAETVWFCASNPVINGSVIHANLGQINS